MSFDLERLKADLAAHGRVARVVVAEVAGSAPREAGASMTVWPNGQRGTIGGGALEWEAAARARTLLRTGGAKVDRLPLGPALGQCCGGHVTLVTEVWGTGALEEDGAVVRRVDGAGDMPLDMRRRLAAARAQGATVPTLFAGGWMMEPVHRPARAIWIYGAGHVGRAIAGVLAAFPEVEVTLVDDAPARFPEVMPGGVAPFVAANPADAVAHAHDHAEHLVLTYSHALDLEICHRILGRAFGHAGLIGSATKWARFRRRLGALGHGEAQIARIECPIGAPELGKHPQAIAIGVAAAFLKRGEAGAARGERMG
ncbi:xanthine dehydrogenase accessory protein XdhC [Ovoidimarina sediminis]|uniref:xanthine dehydrogenase accessory protein XdhC n=1 Tax=Ovoidimarina sediminis TaxID=3079856 RepID=UPI002913D24A|nr:xanthine dehydrogenase accessory protein XdhC [Rhodophyticola sp. MJ-SS7]MDU8943310.1 xanthine dehydrogenase accessory protein XdhC [Rhodophyticola sp. MJ-SS7]